MVDNFGRQTVPRGILYRLTVLIAAAALFFPISAAAADPKPSPLDSFTQKQESLANKASGQLLKAIEQCEKQIQSLPVDEDTKELRLQTIRADRVGFESNERLPHAAELQETQRRSSRRTRKSMKRCRSASRKNWPRPVRRGPRIQSPSRAWLRA